MKNNRPVFESFNSFVRFINEAKEAPMDFKSFLSSNSSFLDADAKKGFDAARLAYDKSPTSASDSKIAPLMGKQLGDLNNGIKSAIDENVVYPDRVQITEKTTTEIKKVVYPALINGKVQLAASIGLPTGADGGELEKMMKDSAWIDINDLLTLVNISNLYYSVDFPYGSSDKKHKKWYSGKSDYIYNSGAHDQFLIASIASGINFNGNSSATPGNDSKVIPDLTFAYKTANKKDDARAYSTFVIYGVGNVVQGGGDTIPDTLIKKDFTKDIIKGEVKAYQVPIDGGDAMFEKGSAKLNLKNKANIDKLLTAALAPLAGKPESIVITGGASYEPDGQGPINKKLVVDRANEVKTYLETLYPDLKGVITVKADDFSKIQAKDVPGEYEKYRKVYLDVKGVLLGDSYTIDKEIEYLVDGEIKADSVEIIQYAITFEFDLPKDKEK
jgi:outer membrane protein OmpA-like peptidoglycan-associated protein